MSETQDMDWHEDSWFADMHAGHLTEDFKAWWLMFYGRPEDYEQDEDGRHEYWLRCGFALSGWTAGKKD